MLDSTPKPVIVAVIGSRKYTQEHHYTQLARALDQLALTMPIAGLVSGGAVGIDQLAERYAQERGLSCQVILPDYARYGRRGPLERNKIIVAQAQLVLALHDNLSKGTAHALTQARLLGVPTIVVVPEEPS